MLKKLACLAMLTVIIGTGYQPPLLKGTAQGKMIARVAAMTDVFQQTGGAPFRILSESFSHGCYTIRAEESVW